MIRERIFQQIDRLVILNGNVIIEVRELNETGEEIIEVKSKNIFRNCRPYRSVPTHIMCAAQTNAVDLTADNLWDIVESIR